MNNSPKNILIDARATQNGYKQHKSRGIGYYAQNLISELINMDLEYILTFLEEQGLPVDPPVLGKSFILHKPLVSKLPKIIESQWSLPLNIPRKSFELVHFLSHEDASFLSSCPYVVSVMDTITVAVRDLYNPWQRMKYKAVYSIAKQIINRATMVIAISLHTKKDIMKYYGIPSDNICVVPLATEQRYFRKWLSNDLLNYRTSIGLPETFLLYVGGIDPRKNLGLLFKAMKALKDNGPYCPPLAFAGHIANQREYPEMMKTIRTLGIEHLIKFLGYVSDEDLPLLFQASAAFVYPSRYEGFGLPILQAMAAGTSVLTTKLSSIPEVAGDAALYIDPDDPVSLVQGITAILSNKELRFSLIASGKQQSAKFSWNRTANETLQVYREALNRVK
jgi:glycosyltransferase involved in cell wall biosynthesis